MLFNNNIFFLLQLGKLFQNIAALMLRNLLFRMNLLMASLHPFVLVPTVAISSNSFSLVY